MSDTESTDVPFPAPQPEQAKKRALHWSHLASLSRCGHAFYLGYIERLKVAPGIALAVGSSVHEVAAKNLTAKSLGEPVLPLEQVRDEARGAFEVQWSRGVALTDDEVAVGMALVKGHAADKAVRLSELHAREFVPILRPARGGVERQWRIEVDDFPFDLCGTMDVCEDRELAADGETIVAPSSVRDLKTAKSTPQARVAGTSGQLTMYSYARQVIDKALPDRVALDYAVDLKTPKTVVLESTRTEAQIEALWHRIENAALAIEREAFVPADPNTSYVCNPQYCGYARIDPNTGKPYCRYYSEAPVTVGLAGSTPDQPAASGKKKPAAPKKEKPNGNDDLEL